MPRRAYNRHAEVCIGEDCPRCQRLISEREFGDDYADSDWQQGQDMYEAYLDRMGGSR